MKGSEIIALWNAANKAVMNAHAHIECEVGDYIRGQYDIIYNGGSVCDFKEKKLNIRYSADCYDNPWMIRRYVIIGEVMDLLHIDKIDPDKEFVVEVSKSIAEKFTEGVFKPKKFVVINKGLSTIKSKHTFDSFDEADVFAQRTAQEEIDRCRRDSMWRKYTARCVKNDIQRARECDQLRHYEYYNYDGHRYWVAVKGIE